MNKLSNIATAATLALAASCAPRIADNPTASAALPVDPVYALVCEEIKGAAQFTLCEDWRRIGVCPTTTTAALCTPIGDPIKCEEALQGRTLEDQISIVRALSQLQIGRQRLIIALAGECMRREGGDDWAWNLPKTGRLMKPCYQSAEEEADDIIRSTQRRKIWEIMPD